MRKSVLSDAVLVSIRTGAIAAVLATLLGTLAGIALARKPGKWTYWFIGLLLLVSVTPEIVDAVSLLPWLVFLGQDLGMAIFNDGTVRLVIGHSLFSVAVVTYIVRPGSSGCPRTSKRPPPTSTLTPLQTFRRVTLPLAMPAILAGAAARVHVQPRQHRGVVVRPGVGIDAVAGLRPQRAAQRLRPEIAAVSTIMLALTLVALAVVAWVLKRAGDSATDIARTMAGG